MNACSYPAWLRDPLPAPDARFAEAASARQSQLTKPPGSLGELEALAVRLAALQARERPSAQRVHITVFAADHGVAGEGVSAFPQAVTAQMIDNFASGGAAIAVLARELGAQLEVVDLGTAVARAANPRVIECHLGPGTANLAREPAMSVSQLARALQAGADAAQCAAESRADLFVGGEMGIANTTAASALACVLLDLPATRLAGPGTGLDAVGIARKAAVIERALALHGAACAGDPLETLRRLGGFEIAALAGTYLACAQRRIPSLVDGFIASVAALCAVRITPALSPWLICSHRSAEPGHAAVLQALDARPLIDLGLRLGEGSGAALAVPLLRAACALHTQMATFGEAGVATGSSISST